MGFQNLVGPQLRYRYERLINSDVHGKVARPRRRHWVKKMNGGLKGLRISRSRRLSFKALSVIVLPRRIAKVYADMIHRIKIMDVVVFPNIFFSTQLGLPFLSHPSVQCRRSAPVTSLHRNLTSIS